MKKILSSLLIFLVTMLSAGTSYAGNNVIYEYDANGNLIRKSAVNVAESGYIPTEKKTFTGKEKVAINAKGVSSANNAKTTVQFWMYWTGQDNLMPFSWHSGYTLWLNSNVFGFNTENGDLFGFPAENIANKWVQITAIFNNGDITKSEIYVDGAKQSLQQYGQPLVRSVSETANISGWAKSEDYRFKGQISDLKIWKRELTQTEISSSVFSKNPVALADLVGEWKLRDEPVQSLKFNGSQQMKLSGIQADSNPDVQTTVQFWMKWDGNQIEMPFSWANSSYDLYFNDRLFGFNTGNGDLYGTSSDPLVNKWVHVSAIFTNGDIYKNELYINGVRQTLAKIGTASNRNVADSAYFSGWNNDTQYQFHGNIAELKVWNRALNPIEIESEMYKTPAIGSNLIYVY
ncbi:LamG domain-containing protein [Paenibacillus jamilae]|uniref:LamG domain-containing protein n=1 Tax=Paenibacillus alvei TaxID=44250 RepID=A0ABT4E498_PAEAL|nr:LamG domain-containing protein [Paenibacillus alvei]MCY9528572.1 LamG domain-containing protein [Paenibacillus alvei]